MEFKHLSKASHTHTHTRAHLLNSTWDRARTCLPNPKLSLGLAGTLSVFPTLACLEHFAFVRVRTSAHVKAPFPGDMLGVWSAASNAGNGTSLIEIMAVAENAMSRGDPIDQALAGFELGRVPESDAAQVNKAATGNWQKVPVATHFLTRRCSLLPLRIGLVRQLAVVNHQNAFH